MGLSPSDPRRENRDSPMGARHAPFSVATTGRTRLRGKVSAAEQRYVRHTRQQPNSARKLDRRRAGLAANASCRSPIWFLDPARSAENPDPVAPRNPLHGVAFIAPSWQHDIETFFGRG